MGTTGLNCLSHGALSPRWRSVFSRSAKGRAGESQLLLSDVSHSWSTAYLWGENSAEHVPALTSVASSPFQGPQLTWPNQQSPGARFSCPGSILLQVINPISNQPSQRGGAWGLGSPSRSKLCPVETQLHPGTQTASSALGIFTSALSVCGPHSQEASLHVVHEGTAPSLHSDGQP